MEKSDKEKLFKHLDMYSFAWKQDISMAIEDYVRDIILKDGKWTPSYWELAEIWELAEDYMEYADYINEEEEIILPF